MRRLSSRLTFFYKFIFPPLWIGGFTVGTLVWFAHPYDSNGTPTPFAPWSFLIITILGSIWIGWAAGPLKAVRMNPRTLFVSNLWKEVRIPLRNVRGIDKSLFTQILRGGQIAVYFWNRTEFGDRIIFKPRWTGQIINPSRPIEDELCKAVAAAGGSGLYPPDREPTTAATL